MSNRPTGKQYLLFFYSGRSGQYETFDSKASPRDGPIWKAWRLDYDERENLVRKGCTTVTMDAVEEVVEQQF
jgi:hypothetical protein